jgi:hypothetical protein
MVQDRTWVITILKHLIICNREKIYLAVYSNKEKFFRIIDILNCVIYVCSFTIRKFIYFYKKCNFITLIYFIDYYFYCIEAALTSINSYLDILKVEYKGKKSRNLAHLKNSFNIFSYIEIYFLLTRFLKFYLCIHMYY